VFLNLVSRIEEDAIIPRNALIKSYKTDVAAVRPDKVLSYEGLEGAVGVTRLLKLQTILVALKHVTEVKVKDKWANVVCISARALPTNGRREGRETSPFLYSS
jgi:hypothetical protein